MRSRYLSQKDRLDLEVDIRLADVWREMLKVDEWDLAEVAYIARVAYGQGYVDSLTEETPGKMCLDLGYLVPARERTSVQR